MQLQFRIDDTNYVTVQCELSKPRAGQSADGPEVTAAVVVDSKLSNLEIDDIFDVAGQILDHLTATAPPAPSPNEDWRDMFRRNQIK